MVIAAFLLVLQKYQETGRVKILMQRQEYILGKYPYVLICDGPWDMPEMKGCGNVVLSLEEYNRQMNYPDAFWKCPVCACGVSFNDENYAVWCESSDCGAG